MVSDFELAVVLTTLLLAPAWLCVAVIVQALRENGSV